MGRSRDKNSDESLRGKLRQSQSELKRLKRQISRLEKQLSRQPIDSIEEDSNDLELPDSSNSSESPNGCPKCSKVMVLIDLGIRKVLFCKSCSIRITSKE